MTGYLAPLLRLHATHSGDSRRDVGSGWPDDVLPGPVALTRGERPRGPGAGYPDLTITGAPGNGVVIAELKTQRGRVSREQWGWIHRLRAAAPPGFVRVEVWRPSDWPHIVRVLHRLANRPCPREFLL